MDKINETPNTEEPARVDSPLDLLVMCFERYLRAVKPYAIITWPDEYVEQFDRDHKFLHDSYLKYRLTSGFLDAAEIARVDLFKMIISEST